MAESAELPGLGQVDKKWVYAGLAVVAGIVGYAWIKNRQSSSAAAVPVVDTTTGTVGGAGGFVNPAPVFTAPSTSTAPSPPTTNTDWVNRVTNDLSNQGYDPQFVGTTLGLYLSHQPLTSDQASLVRTAWAYEGYPPENPGLAIVTGGSTTGGAGTPAPPSGFSARATSKSTVDVWWTPESGVTNYTVQRMDATPGGGQLFSGSWNTVATTTGAAVTVSGLQPNTNYQFRVYATNGSGDGNPTAPWLITTPK